MGAGGTKNTCAFRCSDRKLSTNTVLSSTSAIGRAAIGTVLGQSGRSTIGLLVGLTPETDICGCWYDRSVTFDPGT